MALLNILHLPDPRLRNKALPVRKFDHALHALVYDMFETMYDAPGVGLAATQVNVAQRLSVIDVSIERNSQLVLINPEILSRTGMTDDVEGCLSVPGIYEPVTRAERLKVRALDRDGKPYELEAEGLLAICIQHEIDHLDGKLFVDYLSALKRQRLNKKLEKQSRWERPHR